MLNADDAERHATAITALLTSRLPASFRSYPVAFPVTREPGMTPRQRVQVTGLGAWLTGQLGSDPRTAITVPDWLATPAQRLAEVTNGAVFHDEPGELTRARARLAWYPRDAWFYLLACQWQRIHADQPVISAELPYTYYVVRPEALCVRVETGDHRRRT